MKEFDNIFLALAVAFNAAPFMFDQTPEPPIVPQFLIQQVGRDYRVSLSRPTITAYDQLLARNQIPPIITADLLAHAAVNKGLISNNETTIARCADALAENNDRLFTEKDPKGRPKRAISITPLTRGNDEFIIHLPPACTGSTDQKSVAGSPQAPVVKNAPLKETVSLDSKELTDEEREHNLRVAISCLSGPTAIAGIAALVAILAMKEKEREENNIPDVPRPPSGQGRKKKFAEEYDDGQFYGDESGGSLIAGDWKPQQSLQTILPPEWIQLNRAPEKQPLIIEGTVVNVLNTSSESISSDEGASAGNRAQAPITQSTPPIDRELIYQGLYKRPDNDEIDVLPTPNDYEARLTMLKELARHEPEVLDAILDNRAGFSTQDVRNVYQDPANIFETINKPLTPDDIRGMIETCTYEIEESDPREETDPPEEDEGVGFIHGDTESSIQLSDIGSNNSITTGDERQDPHRSDPDHIHTGEDIDETREVRLLERQLREEDE